MNRRFRAYTFALCFVVAAMSCVAFLLAGVSAQFAIFGYREFLELIGRPPLDLPSAFAECALYGDHPSIPIHMAVWACCMVVCNYVITYRLFSGRCIRYCVAFVVGQLAICSIMAALSLAGIAALVMERHGKIVQEHSPYRGSLAELSVGASIGAGLVTAAIVIYCVVAKRRAGVPNAPSSGA